MTELKDFAKKLILSSEGRKQDLVKKLEKLVKLTKEVEAKEGKQGPKGDRGERGPKGDKGDKGDRGLVGPQGKPGKTHVLIKPKDGKDGNDGKDVDPKLLKEIKERLKVAPEENQNLRNAIDIVSQAQLSMPDFRKLGMGLQGLIDERVPFLGANRTVDLGSQNLTTTGEGSFGGLSLTDNAFLYFDTAKIEGLRYNTDVGYITWISDILAFEGSAQWFVHTNSDGSGTYEPTFILDSPVVFLNTTEGAEADRRFEVNMTSGVRIVQGGLRVEAGNVGIGTDSPSGALHIKELSGTNTRFFWEKVDGTAKINYQLLNNGNFLARYVHSGTDFNPFGILGNDGTPHIQFSDDTGIYTQIHSNGDTYFLGGNVGIGLADPDSKLEVNGDVHIDGDLFFETAGSGLPFAEIYARDNTATTSTSTTKTQILIFDTDGESNNMTPDHTNDHITIVKAGKYKIDTSISIQNSSGSAHVISVEMYKNNGTVVFNNIHAGRNLGTGSDVGNLTMSGIVDLAVDDTIEVWITSDSASARNITVEDIDFSAIMVGGN